MTNALYAKGREKFLGHATIDLDWINDTIKLVLIDTALYTVDIAVDEFLDDIPAGAQVAISNAFTGKTATDGVADADDITLTAVSGATVEALAIFKDTGASATSPLIAYIDVASGLPVTPTGGDVDVVWDNGANKIFKL